MSHKSTTKPTTRVAKLIPVGTRQPIADWATFVCYCKHRVTGEPVQAIELYKAVFQRFDSHIDASTGEVLLERGSGELKHDSNSSSIHIWANENRLIISGNPTRWLQGHAVYCQNVPQQMVATAFALWIKALHVDEYVIVPDHISTLHLTHMYRAPSPGEAAAMLEALKFACVKGRAMRTEEDNGFYFGKTSKLKALKIYRDPNKPIGYVLNPKTKKPEPVLNRMLMGSMLRVECVFHSESLAKLFGRGDKCLNAFIRSDLQQVFEAELSQVRYLAEQHRVDCLPKVLNNAQLGVYMRWANHELVLDRQKHRHHRKRILELTGVDIFVPPSPVIDQSLLQNTPLETFFRECCETNTPIPLEAARRLVPPIPAIIQSKPKPPKVPAPVAGTTPAQTPVMGIHPNSLSGPTATRPRIVPPMNQAVRNAPPRPISVTRTRNGSVL